MLVLDYLKNIEHFLRSNDKAEKWYDVSRHMQFHISKYEMIKTYYALCQTYSTTVV